MSDFSSAAARVMDDYLAHDPLKATLAGLHDHDDRLPDLTADGIADATARAKAYLATLERFPPEHLSAGERIDHALMAAHFESAVRDQQTRQPHRHEPSTYPDIAVTAVYLLLVHDSVPIEDRAPAVEARLAGIPALLAAGKANLTSAPALWTEIAIEETAAAIDFLREDVAPLCDRFPKMQPALGRAIDAFADYQSFLERDLAARDGMPFALGRESFDDRLRREHLLPYDADSLLAFGEDAVRSTLADLKRTAQAIAPGEDWGAIVERLRSEHPSEDHLLEAYRTSVDEARRFVVARGLVTMPDDEELDVVETPIFMRPTLPYAAYMPPGPFEARQRGLYYVTPANRELPAGARAEQMLGHNRYAMLLTNVHEAYPGHHLQLTRANETGTIVRQLLESTVLIEGWALYCEQMVLDEGMTDDPRYRLFQLKDQLWRACRVVIDVKLHTGRMTFDEAVAMLVDVAHLERPNAIGEVRRYTQTPTQPMSYLTGKRQILELRDRERVRLGDGFDVRAFHDRLLSFGSVPLALIEPAFAG